jgi:hypothetical protein
MSRALIRDRNAAAAAEFALVLPLLLVFLFGIIDVGRYMWAINRAEKAVQMGVRMAVVTDFLSEEVGDDYLGQCATPLTQGDPIPEDCFATQTCDAAACDPGGEVANYGAKFGLIANRMRVFMPEIEDGDIEVTYSPSGLGYAGDPNGADVSPLVTVRLSGMTFRPIAFLALWDVPLPEVRSSLTLEDGAGVNSN